MTTPTKTTSRHADSAPRATLGLSGGRGLTGGRGHFRGRGIAMVMVMLALAVGTIITLTFLSSQTTSMAIAHNATRQTQARAIAEDAVDLALAYIRADTEWRDNHTHGTWSADQALNAGTFRVMFEDADDTDLGDDLSEPFTMTVEASFDGVSHRTQTLVTPRGSAAAQNVKVLLVVPNAGSLNADDAARKALVESWGHGVVLISASASSTDFDNAIAEADVVYVSENASSGSVADDLRGAAVGVVNESTGLYDDLGMSSSAYSFYASYITVVNNSHPITADFDLGRVFITDGSANVTAMTGTKAGGLTTLAQSDYGSSYSKLGVIEAGGALYGGGGAPARRVTLPWGGSRFEFDLLSTDGKKILNKALIWAGAEPEPASPAIHWPLDETSGGTAEDTQGSYNATYTLSPTLGQPGARGNAIELDNTLDRVTLPTEALDGKNDYSFAIWFKTTKTGQQSIISGARSGSNNAQLIFLANSRSISLYDPSAPGGRTSWTIDSIADGEWHHLVLVRDGTNRQATMYLDGVSEGTNSVNFVPVAIEHLVLGEEQDSVNGRYQTSQSFVGMLDDVYVFDKALSAQEVATLYEGVNVSVEAPNLVALYEFIEPTPVTPQLVSHWELNEPASQPIAVANEQLVVEGGAIKPYTVFAHEGADAPFARAVSNLPKEKSVVVGKSGHIEGSAYVGPGGDPKEGVYVSGGTIAGDTGALVAPIDWSVPQPPTMKLTHNELVIDGTDVTLSSDIKTSRVIIRNGAKVTISGDVTIWATESVVVESGAKVSIADKSSLKIYASDHVTVKSKAHLNANYFVPNRLMVSVYNGYFEIGDATTYCSGLVYAKSDILVNDGAVLFGSPFAGRDIRVTDNATLSLEQATNPVGTLVADDRAGVADGYYRNGAVAAESDRTKMSMVAQFDGTDDFIEVPHSDAFLLDEGTVSLWVRPDKLSGTQGLIAKDATNYGTGGHIRIYLSSSSVQCRIQSANRSYILASSGNAVKVGKWHHIAVGFGGQGLRLYIDGVEVRTYHYYGGLGTSSGGKGNHEPWVIGADLWKSDDLSSEGWDNPFDGRIDDVRIYDMNLNETQAADLAAGNDPGDAESATVADTSNAGVALDLSISDLDNVTWISGGGLTLDSATTIASPGTVPRLQSALADTNQMTLEAEFTPANSTQDGPARVVTYSNGSSSRNFHLGQTDAKYNARLRTQYNSSGTPEAESGDVLVADTREHVILTYNGQDLKLFRNGVLEVTEPWTGDLSNWNSGYQLLLADEVGGGREWLGTLHRVAIWDRAVNTVQADNLFNGDDPGPPDGGDEGLTYVVDWLEKP